MAAARQQPVEVAPRDRLVTLPDGLPELTLGWQAIAWAGKFLRHPNGPRTGLRWEFIETQVRFLLWWYAVNANGDWLFNHGVRRLAKGSGKSPFAAVMSLLEFCGPVRLFDFDAKAPGGVIGRAVPMPWVQIAATAESQTANTMRMVRALAPKGSRIVADYGLDPGKTIYYKPDGGRLEIITSSAAAAEGSELTFAVGDETEHWLPSRGGTDLAEVLDRNVAKTGSRMVETANAWEPGAGSVAEDTFEAWVLQEEGRTTGEQRILYDARVAPADTDLRNRKQLTAALEFVYHDCYWVDLRSIVERILSPRSKPEVSRQFYLNQPVAAADAWFAAYEWQSRADRDIEIKKTDVVVLGFDGSRKRRRGVTDATGLIGCRVVDGHVFQIRVWEQPEGWDIKKAWEVPVAEVDAEVADAFKTYYVVGFFADPAKWESYVAAWEAKYGARLKVRATRDHPIEWWMTGGRQAATARALEEFESAVLDGDMSHDGSATLTRHVLNARRKPGARGLQIGKDHPDSPRKIDAAVAAVLAWQARLAAVAAGVTTVPRQGVPRRIR